MPGFFITVMLCIMATVFFGSKTLLNKAYEESEGFVGAAYIGGLLTLLGNIVSIIVAIMIFAEISNEGQTSTQTDDVPIDSTMVTEGENTNFVQVVNNAAKPFVTHVTLTVYNATAKQCDSNPLETASGFIIDKKELKNGNLKICAVSDDLKWDLPFESIIEVEGHGQFIVKDRMNKRFKHRIDLLQDDDEPQFMKTNVKVTRIRFGDGETA